MIEYGMSVYSTISLTLFLAEHLLIFWQMKNILNYIDSCERFIEKSAYTPRALGSTFSVIETKSI